MSASAVPASTTISHAMACRIALASIILVAAVARFWHLGDAGFGTEYYAASVRSMLSDSHNVLFGAFDPSGVLAVDKPPLALWIQAVSASLLGYSPFALMLPQAVEGCLAVVLVWHLTRRVFGDIAGLLAALFLSLTPISIAVDRSNNTDSLLVLVLLLAVWALPRAGDPAAPWRLALAMALTGVGFNVKMLAAFGVLPGFAASYAFTARASWPRRMLHLTAAGMVLLVVSVSWIGIVALTPASNRPYIDSTANNSIFDLVINHNAAQRFVPRGWNALAAPGSQAATMLTRLAARSVPPGPARLLDPRLAHQALWLLPLALAGAVGMILSRRREAAFIWIGWTLAYWLVFSAAGGLFAPYYLVMLAPPMAVLAGVGVVTLARAWTGAGWRHGWLPAMLVLSLVWQADLLRPAAWDSVQAGVLMAAGVGVLLACGALIAGFGGGAPIGGSGAAQTWRQRSATAALALGVTALLIAPAAWSIGTIAHEGGRPVARLEPARDTIGRAVDRRAGEVRALLPFLRENRGDAAFLAATSSALLAAPLIIATGEPVMAFGGFLGTIPVLDGAALAQLVDNGDLRFAIIGDNRMRRARAPAETDAMAWIRAHGTRLNLATVAPELRDPRFELFDLRPGQTTPGARN
jgi:4-amino-4-deoxy-L-arabinose transferase-like glycosyltransferase